MRATSVCARARECVRACVNACVRACVRACVECECECAWECKRVCVRHRSESVNRSNVTIGDCDAKGTALGNWAETKLALGEIIPADEYKNTRSGRKY